MRNITTGKEAQLMMTTVPCPRHRDWRPSAVYVNCDSEIIQIWSLSIHMHAYATIFFILFELNILNFIWPLSHWSCELDLWAFKMTVLWTFLLWVSSVFSRMFLCCFHFTKWQKDITFPACLLVILYCIKAILLHSDITIISAQDFPLSQFQTSLNHKNQRINYMMPLYEYYCIQVWIIHVHVFKFKFKFFIASNSLKVILHIHRV